MIRHRTWRSLVVSGIFLAAVALLAAGTAAQTAVPDPSSPPTYAILLRDGSTATVWWDAVSDPARPGWRCEVPAPGSGRGVRTTVPLTASAGDWRAALAEAKASLKALVADSE